MANSNTSFKRGDPFGAIDPVTKGFRAPSLMHNGTFIDAQADVIATAATTPTTTPLATTTTTPTTSTIATTVTHQPSNNIARVGDNAIEIRSLNEVVHDVFETPEVSLVFLSSLAILSAINLIFCVVDVGADITEFIHTGSVKPIEGVESSFIILNQTVFSLIRIITSAGILLLSGGCLGLAIYRATKRHGRYIEDLDAKRGRAAYLRNLKRFVDS